MSTHLCTIPPVRYLDTSNMAAQHTLSSLGVRSGYTRLALAGHPHLIKNPTAIQPCSPIRAHSSYNTLDINGRSPHKTPTTLRPRFHGAPPSLSSVQTKSAYYRYPIPVQPSQNETQTYQSYPKDLNLTSKHPPTSHRYKPVLAPHSLPPQQFQVLFTLVYEFFSPFLHSTCLLSVSHSYLAFDALYHRLCAVLPNNTTRSGPPPTHTLHKSNPRGFHPLWRRFPTKLP